ncbi:DUF4129 domain-containing protein [Deinococcus sp. Marseille-Q6407]|uniref:DUF4129 domain-containing protein n=1 Tax=Deinococcus sp. Marseille-Q6407 TaxID=2969223 RepID=UPI0021BE53C9|nr:DUF4129 domain-containing protein [Deinococcus sp. Marseille-Q6407]
MTQAAPAAAGPFPLWRTVAFAALSLVLAGMVPLPALLGLMAVFALTAQDTLRAYRSQLTLLVLAVNLLVTLWLAMQAGNQHYMVAAFFVVIAQMATAFLVVQAAERAEERRGRGWLWLLPAFVLAPHPLGLVSLGAAILLQRGTDDDTLTGGRWQGTRQDAPGSSGRAPVLWPWLAGAAAAALLAGLLLPRASLWDQATDYMGVTEHITVVDHSAVPGAPAKPSALPGLPSAPTFLPGTPGAGASQGLERTAQGYLNLLAVLLLLTIILAALFGLWRQLRRPGGPPDWRRVWPLLALLALPLSLLAVMLAAQFQALDITVADGQHAPAPAGGDAGPLEAAVQIVVDLLVNTPLGNPNIYNLLFLLLGTLLLFAVLAGVWRLLTARSREIYAYAETHEAAPVTASAPVAASAPLHRVRLAYAQVERHLTAAGRPRRSSETPAEYLRRVAAEWPSLAAPLATLGAAYSPVRYGGGISEGQAEQAERSAAEVLATQPSGK